MEKQNYFHRGQNRNGYPFVNARIGCIVGYRDYDCGFIR